MEWHDGKNRTYTQTDGRFYDVQLKRNGKWFLEVSRPGSALVRLPYREFESSDAARAWVEELEARESHLRESNRAQAISL